MRARGIKPGFFKNEDLADGGPWAMLLFAGLWCLADREGRLEDRPRRIKAEIFPYSNVDIDRELSTLQKKQFITRYSVSGTPYILVLNFTKHQSPHHTERASELPAPPTNESSSDNHGEVTVDSPLEDGENPPDSGLLTPDSLTPDSLNGCGSNVRQFVSANKAAFDALAAFNELWEEYPAKGRTKRVLSQQYYSEEVRSQQQHRHVMFRIRTEWARSEKWFKGFVLALPEFIHNRCWDEEPESHEAALAREAPVSKQQAILDSWQ